MVVVMVVEVVVVAVLLLLLCCVLSLFPLDAQNTRIGRIKEHITGEHLGYFGPQAE